MESGSSPRNYLLLDRDGTLIQERNYLSDPDDVELIQGVATALNDLRELGYGAIVVTNQSGVGRGYYAVESVLDVHARVSELLATEGAVVDAFYYCPHIPADNCDCRKPLPGMVHRAAKDLPFKPFKSIMIGDKPCDIQCGKSIGARTILVRSGYGSEFERQGYDEADRIVDGLPDAVDVIQGWSRSPVQ